MAVEHLLDGLHRGPERRVIQRAFGKTRRVSGRKQQAVALPQRNREALGQIEHHFP